MNPLAPESPPLPKKLIFSLIGIMLLLVIATLYWSFYHAGTRAYEQAYLRAVGPSQASAPQPAQVPDEANIAAHPAFQEGAGRVKSPLREAFTGSYEENEGYLYRPSKLLPKQEAQLSPNEASQGLLAEGLPPVCKQAQAIFTRPELPWSQEQLENDRYSRYHDWCYIAWQQAMIKLHAAYPDEALAELKAIFRASRQNTEARNLADVFDFTYKHNFFYSQLSHSLAHCHRIEGLKASDLDFMLPLLQGDNLLENMVAIRAKTMESTRRMHQKSAFVGLRKEVPSWLPDSQIHGALAPCLEHLTLSFDYLEGLGSYDHAAFTHMPKPVPEAVDFLGIRLPGSKRIEETQEWLFWDLNDYLAPPIQARRTAIVALAITRFELEQGSWPPDQQALLPQYLEEIPEDITRGCPPEYDVKSDGRPILTYQMAVPWSPALVE